MADTAPRSLRMFLERFLLERLGAEDTRRVAVDSPAVRADALALLPPEDLGTPWLVFVDAERWLVDGEAKKDSRGRHLVREDLEALRPVLAAHVKSGRPGAVAIFVHAADPPHAKGFRTNALRLADRLGLERALLGIDSAPGTRDLALVMSSLEDLAATAAEAWHALAREG